ncbi:MAG: DNA mismatch repair endonuclease MutL [Roseburia sp.]|nr:DNA mismatch repair endonuclease MutL [Roseburia sp.]
MAKIHILDSETVDKIAAGEVVERPASVVKELVENAIDASATAITVEAKDGGISLIRVTDNGSGMEKEQLRTAFLRHATSKIDTAEDLSRVSSLGFRGEALSSIAAVSKVELITKTRDRLTGTRIVLEGAVEKEFEEIGAPEGTTFLVRGLFFNTPVRRKFLKQPATEGGYIVDLMEHLALSRPDISFKLVMGGQMRFHTSGNGDLKEVIYRIYGREIANAIVPVQGTLDGVTVEGYLGKPVLVRSNRNFEIYFINGRFVRSNVVAKAVEEGYKEYLMQHKFPMCVLHISMDKAEVDVNVHPTKMDVRFSDNMAVSGILSQVVSDALHQKEMIPSGGLSDEKEREGRMKGEQEAVGKSRTPEPFETQRSSSYRLMEESRYQAEVPKAQEFVNRPVWSRVKNTPAEPVSPEDMEIRQEQEQDFFVEEVAPPDGDSVGTVPGEIDSGRAEEAVKEAAETVAVGQLNLFEEKLLSVENRSRYRMIGQVFDTYWMIQFEDKLFIIDQHAAHEKVKYERLMKQYREKAVVSQALMPPVIVSLSGQEETVLRDYLEVFCKLGFEIEEFGGNEYALRSVPVDLYGCSEREMFLEVLDELAEGVNRNHPRVVEEKLASMSCKAAVKGNNRLSFEEADRLIDELLTLENPYHCPHGRPTIITISKYEMEKKFKRIV